MRQLFNLIRQITVYGGDYAKNFFVKKFSALSKNFKKGSIYGNKFYFVIFISHSLKFFAELFYKKATVSPPTNQNLITHFTKQKSS